MSRLSLLERYNEQLTEEIRRSELLNDIRLIKLIIKGKRDVVIVNLTKKLSQVIEKRDLGVIPLRMTSNNTILSIIYRDKEKAYKLYDIVKERGRHINDDDVKNNYKELSEEKDNMMKILKENFQYNKILSLMKKLQTYLLLNFFL